MNAEVPALNDADTGVPSGPFTDTYLQPQKVLEVNPPSVVPERLLLAVLVVLAAVTAGSAVYMAMVLHQFVAALQQLSTAFGG